MDRIGVVCALAAALLFANTWHGDFVYDDSRAIVSNEDLRPSSPWSNLWRHDFWGTPLDHAGSHQSWRPLCSLTFRLNFSWSGLDSRSYHAINIVLHSMVTLCFASLMKSIVRQPWVRFLAGMAFAAHPIHCEAVASIVGRAELGAALHTLVALLAYRAHLRTRKRGQQDNGPSSLAVNNNNNKSAPLRKRIKPPEYSNSESQSSSSSSDGESLTVPALSTDNRFEQRRQSLLSLFIETVTICCCSSSDLIKKRQYRVASLDSSSSTSSSNHVHQRANRRHQHQRHQSDADHRSDVVVVGDNYCKDRSEYGSVYLVASLTIAASALLWKETGIAAIPLCAAMEIVHRIQWRRSPTEPGNRQSTDGSCLLHLQESVVKSAKNLALLGAVWTAQLAARWYALGGGGWSATTPWFAAADNPASRDSSILTRTLTFLYLPAFNLGLLLWPARLSFDWSMDAVPPISRLGDARNIATLTFYAALCALAVKSIRTRNGATLMALAMLVLPFLPASNLFFYVGFVVAERVLYIPSMGFCLLLGAGMEKLIAIKSSSDKRNERSRLLIKACFVITLALWSVKTFQRNGDWSSEEQLYRSGIPINPAKAYGNLAAILAREQRQTEAEHAYRQALAHRPNMAETHFNLALLLQSQGRHQEASSSYLQSIHYRPNLAAAYVNLGVLYSKLGQPDQAVHWWRSCSQLDGSGVRDPQSHRHSQIQSLLSWGQLELARGHPQTAIQLYKQALRRSPTSIQQFQALYYAMGEAYQSTGDFRESERWFRTAVEQAQLDTEPKRQQSAHHRHQAAIAGAQSTTSGQVAAHLNYARFLAKNASRHEEAEQLFRQAQLMAPTDPTVYMFTGQFLLEASRPREAAESFVRAAHLAPADFEAVFNAATTLREVKELDRAELFYRKAVELRPQDVTVYRNLGALLHVKGQWREAEDNYQLALRLVPDDRITLTNLKRLHQLVASKVGNKATINENNNNNASSTTNTASSTES